jgi:hypothetical protein
MDEDSAPGPVANQLRPPQPVVLRLPAATAEPPAAKTGAARVIEPTRRLGRFGGFGEELLTELRQSDNWLSIFWRNPYSVFTAPERLTVQVVQILLTIVVNAFLLSDDGGGFSPGQRLEDLPATLIVTAFGILIRIPALFALRRVFEMAGPRHLMLSGGWSQALTHHSDIIFLEISRKLQRGRIPNTARYVGYAVLGVVMVVSYVFSLAYGMRFENDANVMSSNVVQVWISSTMIALGLDIILISPCK